MTAFHWFLLSADRVLNGILFCVLIDTWQRNTHKVSTTQRRGRIAALLTRKAWAVCVNDVLLKACTIRG